MVILLSTRQTTVQSQCEQRPVYRSPFPSTDPTSDAAQSNSVPAQWLSGCWALEKKSRSDGGKRSREEERRGRSAREAKKLTHWHR